MKSLEKFTLQWDKFQVCLYEIQVKLCPPFFSYFTQDNAKITFHDIRKTEDFSDVTLVCEDGHQIQAHRVILSSSSLFFRYSLSQFPC